MTCASCGAATVSPGYYCTECGGRFGEPPPPDDWARMLEGEPDEPAAAAGRANDVRTAAGMLAAAIALAGLGQLMLRGANPAAAVPWYGAAVLCFALALAAGLCAFLPDERDILAPARRLRPTFPNVALAAGLGLELVVLARLFDGSRTGSDLVLWALALGLAGLGVLPGHQGWPSLERPAIDAARIRRHVPDALFVAGVVLAFAGLASADLEHWRYSVIGDEYLFYNWARGVLANGIDNPFSHDGVYGTHPVLTTVYQAAVMWVAGDGATGWRMASIAAIAFAIPAIYLLGHALIGRAGAIVATVAFASSHYLMAYAHTGYDNAYAIAPAAWAIWLFVEGVRRANAWMLYCGGLVAGLGFYTFFSARSAVVVLALLVVTSPVLLRRVVSLWPAALGFALTVAPLFAASGYEAIGVMFDEVPGGYSEDVTGSPMGRIGANLSTNLLAFNANQHAQHYVSGSLLDAFSAVAAVVGLGLALGAISRSGPRLLVLWFVAGFVATGLLSPYPYTVISRLSFLLAPLALLIGLTAQAAYDAFQRLGMRTAGVTALAAFAVIVVALNVNRFWWESPRTLHLSPAAVAIGASRAPVCAGRYSTIIAPAVGAALVPALESYGDPFVFAVDQSLLSQRPLDELLFPGCVIFTDPNAAESRTALGWLNDNYPGGTLHQFSDAAGKGTVLVFVS